MTEPAVFGTELRDGRLTVRVAEFGGFTRAVAREAAPKNITVNALALGYFSAGVIHTLSADMQQAVLRQIPFGRFGDPRHVGQLIVFLCSEAGSYITGQTININGGVYM